MCLHDGELPSSGGTACAQPVGSRPATHAINWATAELSRLSSAPEYSAVDLAANMGCSVWLHQCCLAFSLRLALFVLAAQHRPFRAAPWQICPILFCHVCGRDSHTSLTARYGPFWVATTLVFVTAVTGNYANYVSYRKSHPSTDATAGAWYYDVNKVGTSHLMCWCEVELSTWARACYCSGLGLLLCCWADCASHMVMEHCSALLFA